jgi:hypothetical protein
MQNPLRWLSLVMLEQPRLPAFEEVADFVAKNFDDAPPMAVAGFTENMFTCTLGEDTAAATLVPRPIPWSQLEGPCATAWYWPTAAEEVRDHQAHLLVTLIDEGGKPVQKSERLTQLVAGLLEGSRSPGVFWGPGRLVHPKQAFIEQAVQSTPSNLPLFLWIDFRIERSDAGTRLYTTGLEALGIEELEATDFQGEPQLLLEHAYNIAHYLLHQGKRVNDGDTIGLTDEVLALARRGTSMFDEELEVLRLEFQSGGP